MSDVYTKLLLHCDGADESTTFLDSSGYIHTMTAVGTAQVDTAYRVFGTGAAMCDGNSDWLTTPAHADWAFGTGNFTLDFRVRLRAKNKHQHFFQCYDGAGDYWLFRITDDNKLYFYWYQAGTVRASFKTTAAPTINVDTWYHIEMSRNGSTCLMFVNGVSQAVTQTTAFGDLIDCDAVLHVGGEYAGTSPLDGWMEEIRISKGICRNTSNFTPPAAAYSDLEEITVDVYDASAEYLTDVAENVGDDNAATFWNPGNYDTVEWVSCDFGEAHSVAKIDVWAKADGANGVRLKDFNLQYSDNNSTWFTQEAFQHSNTDGNEHFMVASPSSHRYWRLQTQSQWNTDSSWQRVHEFHLFEVVEETDLEASADIVVSTTADVKEEATLDAAASITVVTNAVVASEQTLGVSASVVTSTEADAHEEAEIAASADIEVSTIANTIVALVLLTGASASIEITTAVDIPDTIILSLGASAAIELVTSIIKVDVTYAFNHGNILGDIITFIRPGQNTNCDQGSAGINLWSAPIPIEVDGLPAPGTPQQVEQSPRDNNDLAGIGQIRGHEYFWYEMAHLLPRIVQELGNLVSEQVIDCDLYNADRNNKITVSSITNDLGTGIDVAGVPSTPFDIESQDSLVFTLTVKTIGDVTIDASYTLHLSTGEDYTIYITGSRVVMFPIRPEAPLREHLLFDTKIIEAVDSSEQRIANREYPRGMFEATYKNGQRTIEMILFDRQAKVVAFPAWHEPAFLNAAHSTGALTVNINTTDYANFYVGGYAVVLQDEHTYDALKIQSMTATSLTFESGLSFDYTAKAQVMPLLTAYIEASSASLKYPYNQQYFNLRIHVDPEVNDIASAAAFNTYNSEPFMDGPNMIEGGQLAEAIRTKIFVVDNLTGLRTQHSAWDHSKRYSKKGWKTNTRQELWELRQLLHYLKGRQVGFYIPTFWKDITITQTLAIGTLTMTIANIGYVVNAQERWPKQVIRIHLKDSTILTRTIQNSSIVSNVEEQLTVDTPWPASYTADEIERIEFLEKVRIDVDDITIVHYNGLGQAECIVPIKETENS